MSIFKDNLKDGMTFKRGGDTWLYTDDNFTNVSTGKVIKEEDIVQEDFYIKGETPGLGSRIFRLIFDKKWGIF